MTNEESNTGSTYAEEGVDGGKVVYLGGEYCMIHWQRARGKFVEDAKMHWLYTGLAPKERRK